MFNILHDVNDKNDYPVYVGCNTIQELDIPSDRRVLLVVDTNVPNTLVEEVIEQIDHCQTHHLYIEVREDKKTWDTVQDIVEYLSDNNFDRYSLLVSVGGGCLSDMVGFAASMYMRGIDWIAIPTTLLSQVDASIGGKTGCNFLDVKNLIGAYYPPKKVIIDTRFLDSLNTREYISGLAEVIKYGLIRDYKFYEWIEINIEDILSKKQAVLQTMIYKCCSMKKEIVKLDVEDKGIRRILNFGHSFAHSIESATNFDKYLHGEAVSIGMLIAIKLAVRISMVDKKLFNRVQCLLIRCGLPVDFDTTKCRIERVYQFLDKDKKVLNGKLTLILPCDLGKVMVVDNIRKNVLKEVIEDYVSV